MDDLVTVLAILGAIAAVFVKAIRAVSRKLGEIVKTAPIQTPDEQALQRELEEFARRHRGGDEIAAPAQPAPRLAARPAESAIFTEPAPAAYAPAIIPKPPAKGRQAKRAAPHSSAAALPRPAATIAGRSISLNPRTMARVAILSEIWRPPLALRKEEPWERG